MLILHTGTTGRSGTGDLSTRRLAKPRRRVPKNPGPRTPVPEPPLSLCVASQNPKECLDSACQICKFILKLKDSVFLRLSITDVPS